MRAHHSVPAAPPLAVPQPSSASPPEPEGKAKAESFSYVEPPTTRFVAELPATLPPASQTADADIDRSTAAAPALDVLGDDLFAPLASMSGPRAPPRPASPGTSRLDDTLVSSATAGLGGHPVGPAPAAPLPTSAVRASAAPVQMAERDTWTSSKSRRRLTVTLGSLLPGGKRDKLQGVEASAKGSVSGAGSASSGQSPLQLSQEGSGLRSRRSSSASRRPMPEGRAGADTPSVESPSALSSSTKSSKAPVALAKVFRHRRAGSQGSQPGPTSSPLMPTTLTSPQAPGQSFFETAPRSNRPSLEQVTSPLRLSDSSEGSVGAATVAESAVSTAPTSPDVLACSEEDACATPAERRRRGSLALAEQLSGDGKDDEIEDLRDFVVASGSPKASSAPFTRRRSNADSFGIASPVLDSDASRNAQTSGASSPPLHPRRLTRNIEGLSLSDLRRLPSEPANPYPALPSQTAAPFAVTSGAETEGTMPQTALRNSSNRARLGALPRLLSTNQIAGAGTSGEGESETDTEADSDSDEDDEDEDEGDHYATSDEGPVTTRSPVATPAARSPAAASFSTPGTQTPGSRPPASRMPSLSGLSTSTAVGGPSNWVSFAELSTPATVRTARPQNGISYFDLPRPASSSTGTANNAGVSNTGPPKTPLAYMSMSDVARGKRPALQEDVEAAASAAASPARGRNAETTSDREPSVAAVSTSDAAVRAGLYRLRSQSVVALASPSMVDEDGEELGTASVTELDPVWQRGVPAAQKTPGFISFGLAAQKQQDGGDVQEVLAPQSPKAPLKMPMPLDISAASSPSSTQPSSPTTGRSRPTTGNAGTRLHRTRSMYELRDAPPAYTSMYRQSGTGAVQVILPREEEGREGLPGYSCAIHIEGYMPRKLEFTAPGVQARDRAWKRQYFVLHGTSIKIFKYDLRSHPLPGEHDWSSVPADIAGHDGPPPLHFHEGEYGAEPPSQGHRFSIELAKAKAKDRIIASATASAENALVRHYSLQNAESGLAADYLKRKHVVRVRAEGEQFLLQAKDDRGVIDLIEALQAATNVALDLDARPLPKFITLPRRRRRRRPARPADAAATNAAGNATAGTGGAAATSSSAAPAPAQDRMGDMLAEEQNAYSRRSGGTVM